MHSNGGGGGKSLRGLERVHAAARGYSFEEEADDYDATSNTAASEDGARAGGGGGGASKGKPSLSRARGSVGTVSGGGNERGSFKRNIDGVAVSGEEQLSRIAKADHDATVASEEAIASRTVNKGRKVRYQGIGTNINTIPPASILFILPGNPDVCLQ